MKLVFGVLSLLVALAIVAVIAKQQTRAVIGPGVAASSPSGRPANVAGQSRQMQEQVRSDVQKALDEGMKRNADRADEAGK
ncbi:hypothetical protein BH09PSE5_BH09PSE5_26290 [soil metagenome]